MFHVYCWSNTRIPYPNFNAVWHNTGQEPSYLDQLARGKPIYILRFGLQNQEQTSMKSMTCLKPNTWWDVWWFLEHLQHYDMCKATIISNLPTGILPSKKTITYPPPNGKGFELVDSEVPVRGYVGSTPPAKIQTTPGTSHFSDLAGIPTQTFICHWNHGWGW